MQLLEILLDSDMMIDILREHSPAVEWLKVLRDQKAKICLPGLDVLDALIGQMAEDLMMPLHTFNTRHFQGAFKVDTVQVHILSSRGKQVRLFVDPLTNYVLGFISSKRIARPERPPTSSPRRAL